jgi:isocitrate lyase
MSPCPTLIVISDGLISDFNMEPYPFKFDAEETTHQAQSNQSNVTLHLKNVRGRLPSPQASRLRSLWLEAHKDPAKILAFPCSYDGLSSRLIEEAGFPMIFISGFAVSSAHGLPDTGYIAMQEMCDKIQEIARQVTIPILADGDTGYGSPMNVKRTVESFAKAGAAGVMIEDQTWPKRKGHHDCY